MRKREKGGGNCWGGRTTKFSIGIDHRNSTGWVQRVEEFPSVRSTEIVGEAMTFVSVAYFSHLIGEGC